MRRLYPSLFDLLALGLISARLQAQKTVSPGGETTAALAADVASPEAIVAAVYSIVSGPADQERDWDRLRSLLLPGACLIWAQTTATGEERLHPMRVDGYIGLAAPYFRTGAGFWEREVSRRVDRFGNIAHVFSTYESRREGPQGPMTARGINSFQLVRHENRGWIASLAWDEERKQNPIPTEYRPGSE